MSRRRCRGRRMKRWTRRRRSSVNGRTNFKLVLPHSFRKVKNENLKGEFARSQRSLRSSLFNKFSVYKRIVYLRQYIYKYMN